MKLLKNLFTVPAGEKVTERHFKRVLISSVCGILLCMTCLMSSTWAWFTATLETGAFTIEVAQHSVEVTVDGAAFTNMTELMGEHTAKLAFVTKADATDSHIQYMPGRYIIVTLFDAENGSKAYYVSLSNVTSTDSDGNIRWETQLKLQLDEARKVAFSSSWTTGNAEPVESNTLVVAAQSSEISDGGTSTPTQTTAPTETTTAPTETTTAPTEATTAPTETTTAPAETTVPATEPKTE